MCAKLKFSFVSLKEEILLLWSQCRCSDLKHRFSDAKANAKKVKLKLENCSNVRIFQFNTQVNELFWHILMHKNEITNRRKMEFPKDEIQVKSKNLKTFNKIDFSSTTRIIKSAHQSKKALESMYYVLRFFCFALNGIEYYDIMSASPGVHAFYFF